MGENPVDVAALKAARDAARQAEQEQQDTQQQIAQGIAAIRAAQDQASADVAVADGLRAQAVALSATITKRAEQVAAFVPAPTYSPAQLAAVRDEIVWLLGQLKTLTDAQAGMYVWRRAVDENAVLTDAALLGLAWLSQKEGDR